MLSHASRFRVRGSAVLSMLTIAAVVAACGSAAAPAAAPGGAGGGDYSGPGNAPAASAGSAQGGGGQGTGGNGGQAGGGGGSQGGTDQGVIDQAGLLIVKNGALAIQVGGLDAAIDAANAQVKRLGGYASASQRFGSDDDAQATVTFRIPVARWDEALTALRGLGEKVIDERYSTEEVTAQVVDLDARITNLRASEAAIQAIMDRASDLDEVLTVQDRLTATRSQIEQLTAQKTNLEGKAAFSTLAVTFSLKQNPVLAEQQGFDPAGEIEQASASLVSILQAVATAGIWFGIVWLPILTFFAIVGGIALGVGRRLRRAGPRGGTPIEPSAEAGA